MIKESDYILFEKVIRFELAIIYLIYKLKVTFTKERKILLF